METKRVAIEQLSGAALDWAVAKASGVDVSLTMAYPSNGRPGLAPWDDCVRKPYTPTMNWSQCGPLIERYKITVYEEEGDGFVAGTDLSIEIGGDLFLKNEQCGGTYRQAACRAIVAAHNPSGYVEVPDELVEGE